MNAIVRRTSEYAKRTEPLATDEQQVIARETQLIQSRDDILVPPKLFNAVKITHQS